LRGVPRGARHLTPLGHRPQPHTRTLVRTIDTFSPVHEMVRPDPRHLEFRTRAVKSVLAVEVGRGGAGVAPDHLCAGEYGVREGGAQQGAALTSATDVVDGGHAAQSPAAPRLHF